MTPAKYQWLDLRVPHDDAARQASLELLDQVATALQTDATAPSQPVTIIDVGAGTGNSARWFRQHLQPRLTGRELRWVLLDTDQAALQTAAQTMPDAETIVAPITQLPQIVDDLLPLGTAPGQLLITGSAVLDVFTAADLDAITRTLMKHSGLGLFLLSITGDWQLNPADPDDAVINQAFAAHQLRDGKLGADSPGALLTAAQQAGATVESRDCPWWLTAPRDQEFIVQFLSERIEAVIEEEPQLRTVAADWLNRRFAQLSDGLTVEVDHLDIFIDGRTGFPD